LEVTKKHPERNDPVNKNATRKEKKTKTLEFSKGRFVEELYEFLSVNLKPGN